MPRGIVGLPAQWKQRLTGRRPAPAIALEAGHE